MNTVTHVHINDLVARLIYNEKVSIFLEPNEKDGVVNITLSRGDVKVTKSIYAPSAAISTTVELMYVELKRKEQECV